MLRRSSGFTLVESPVIIAIVAALMVYLFLPDGPRARRPGEPSTSTPCRGEAWRCEGRQFDGDGATATEGARNAVYLRELLQAESDDASGTPRVRIRGD